MQAHASCLTSASLCLHQLAISKAGNDDAKCLTIASVLPYEVVASHYSLGAGRWDICGCELLIEHVPKIVQVRFLLARGSTNCCGDRFLLEILLGQEVFRVPQLVGKSLENLVVISGWPVWVDDPLSFCCRLCLRSSLWSHELRWHPLELCLLLLGR